MPISQWTGEPIEDIAAENEIFPPGTEVPSWHNAEPDPSSAQWLDGLAEESHQRQRTPTAAIFIHAGAGYHSTANEKIHLDACST